MSAAATAAGYLYASGRLTRKRDMKRAQREAEQAAEDLRLAREERQQERISTAPQGARR